STKTIRKRIGIEPVDKRPSRREQGPIAAPGHSPGRRRNGAGLLAPRGALGRKRLKIGQFIRRIRNCSGHSITAFNPLLSRVGFPSPRQLGPGEWKMIFLQRLLRDDSGATAIEYGLIAALIAVAAVTVLGTVGGNLTATFQTVADKL